MAHDVNIPSSSATSTKRHPDHDVIFGQEPIRGPKIADLTPPLVKAVECAKCGNLHRVTAETFITIQGAIFVGTEGGIVGNRDGTPVVYCRRLACLEEIIVAMGGEPIKLTR